MFKLIFKDEEQEREIILMLILAVLLFTSLFVSYIFESRVERGENSVPTRTVQNEFPQVFIKAKSAYVYDARTKEVIFAYNENERLPLASLTKLMSALVAQELSPEYGTVTVTEGAIATLGDSGLKENERWSLKNLLDFSLMSSSNDGIRAVALALGSLRDFNATEDEIVNDFVHRMNVKAQELDLKNTSYLNETGLDLESEDGSANRGGAYGSARDMALLLENIITYHPTLLEATREDSGTFLSQSQEAHVATNTNLLVDEIPGLLASKTGYTELAGGNLAIAFDPELGRPIVIVVLGSTHEGRFEDARQLVNATLSYLNN